MTETLRIETANAGAYANATEADLHRLVMQLDRAHAYVVVHREPEDGLFAQARIEATPADGFRVEYSLKSGQLRCTNVATRDEVYELLAGWAFSRPGWKTGHTWESFANDDVIDLKRNCEWSEDGGDLVVRFPPLDIEGRGATKDEATAALMATLEEATQDRATALQFSEWASAHIVKRSELTL